MTLGCRHASFSTGGEVMARTSCDRLLQRCFSRKRIRRGITRVDAIALIVILTLAFGAACQMMATENEEQRSVRCKNNLARIGKAMKFYEGQGQGNLAGPKWKDNVAQFIEDDDVASVLSCPSADKSPSYALNGKTKFFGAGDYEKITVVDSDRDMITIEPVSEGKLRILGAPVFWHGGAANCLMYGGSVYSTDARPVRADFANKYWLPEREPISDTTVIVVVD